METMDDVKCVVFEVFNFVFFFVSVTVFVSCAVLRRRTSMQLEVK